MLREKMKAYHWLCSSVFIVFVSSLINYLSQIKVILPSLMDDLTNVLYNSFKQNIKIYYGIKNIVLSAQSILSAAYNLVLVLIKVNMFNYVYN